MVAGNDHSNPLSLNRYWKPVVLIGHFAHVFGSAYIDIELEYQGLDPLEINTAIFYYVYRDTLLDSGLSQ